MAPPVILVLALLTPAFSLPFAIPEYTPKIQIEQETSGTNSVPQVEYEIQEKTGVPVSSECSAGYLVNQDVSQPVSRVQDSPVNVEQAQPSHAEPLFLPPQPVPVGHADQIVRPVIVPAEAIASGRVIIMAVEPIQQRAFPDVIIVPQQQPIVPETPIQQVQSVEKQTPYQENYSPVQPNSNAQEILQPNFNEVPQRQSQAQPESSQQVDPQRQAVEKEVNQPVVQVQPPQQHVKKEAQTGVNYTPVAQTVEPIQQVQTVETVQQEYNVQPWTEKQFHQNPQKVESVPQQQVNTAQAVSENVQKQVECVVPQLQSEPQQRVNVQETGEKVQQSVGETYQQQTYSVQPEQIVQVFQSVEPQQEVQQQIPQVELPVIKTENQQVHDVPQQVNTFAASQV